MTKRSSPCRHCSVLRRDRLHPPSTGPRARRELPVHDLAAERRAGQCRAHRRAADRDRREVPIGRRRVRHRHPFLQRRAEHRHARRPPLVGGGHAARRGDVHGRDRVGLAGSAVVARGRGRRQHHLRRVVSRGVRFLRVRWRILRDRRRRRAAAARAAGRRRRTERRVQVRGQRIPGARAVRTTTGSTSCSRPISGRTRRRRRWPPSCPANGATGVALSSPARATFSEAIDAGHDQRGDVRRA